MTGEPNAYDLPTFCARNGISQTTAYKLARKGELAMKKVLGKTIITAEAERDWLASLPDYQPTAPSDWRRKPRRAARQQPADAA